MKKIYQKIVCSLIILFSISVFYGFNVAFNSTIRFQDGLMGILERPESEERDWLTNLIITEPERVQVSAQGAVFVTNFEQIANNALKAAAQALVQAFASLLMNLFDQLLSALEAFVGSIDGLRDAFGQFVNSTVLWVNNQIQNFGQTTTAKDIAVQVVPDATAEAQGLVAGAVENLTTSIALTQIPNAAPTNISKASIEENRQILKEAVTATNNATCQTPTNIPFFDFLNGPTDGCGAAVERALLLDGAVENLSQEVVRRTEAKIQETQAQSGQCGIGYNEVVNTGPDQTGLNILNTSSTDILASISPSNSSSEIIAENIPNSQFRIAMNNTASAFEPKALSPKDCETYSTAQKDTTLASTQTEDQKCANELCVGAIFDALQNAINSFFQKLIQTLLDRVVNLVNRFLSTLPSGGFLGNALTQLTGGASNLVSGYANVIRSEISKVRIT